MYRVKSFKVIRESRDVKVDTVVYDSMGCDYGCASDDSRHTGIQHTSVTFKSDGSYPFFTIPVRDLKEIHETETTNA